MEVVPGLSATYRIRVQGVPQLVSSRVTTSQVVKAPRSLSLTQLGKSGYGDYMSSHAFSIK